MNFTSRMKNINIKYLNNEEETEEESDDTNTIKVSGNNIYFYSEITRQSILDLTLIIKELTVKLLNLINVYEVDIPCIKLHINSEGGEVFAVFSILKLIESNTIPIHSIIEGQACSAATMLSVVAEKRFITEHSYMLIHNLSSDFWGKMHELEDEMINLKELTRKIKSIYKTYSTIKKTELEKLLKKDLLLTPNVCKRHGLIDEII